MRVLPSRVVCGRMGCGAERTGLARVRRIPVIPVVHETRSSGVRGSHGGRRSDRSESARVLRCAPQRAQRASPARTRPARALRVSPRSTIGSGDSSGRAYSGAHRRDVLAVRVELLRLQLGVEHAEVRRGIGPRPGDPLPVERVAGAVGVDERVPEPLLAAPPVDEQVLDEERCRRPCARGCACSRCARARACPASTSGMPVRPCCHASQLRRVQARPRERVELRRAGSSSRDRGSGTACAHANSRQPSSERNLAPLAAARSTRLVPDRVRADLAPAQARRQPRGRARGRLVAASVVVGEVVVRGTRAGVARAAGSPGSHVSRRPAGPVRVGAAAASQSSRSSLAATAARSGISRGSGSGARGAGIARHARQNGVNTENGVPGSGLHRPRLEQERMPRTTRPSSPSSRSAGLELGVDLALRAAVAPIPEDRAGPGISSPTARDDATGRPAPQHEARRRARRARSPSDGERAVQPPLRRAAERTDARRTPRRARTGR